LQQVAGKFFRALIEGMRESETKDEP